MDTLKETSTATESTKTMTTASRRPLVRRLTLSLSTSTPKADEAHGEASASSSTSLPFLNTAPAHSISMNVPQMSVAGAVVPTSKQDDDGGRTTVETATRTTRVFTSSKFPAQLGYKLAGDAVVAVSVTGMIAPFLTVVDKALVQSSAGTHTMLSSSVESIANMARQPVQYVKSPTFLWMWMTYAATYTAANALRTVTEHQEYMSSSSATAASSAGGTSSSSSNGGGMAAATLFVGTTAVNTTASLVKDRAYARLFGNNQAAAVPRISYALWMTRDLTVVGSSFLLPNHVSNMMQEYQRDNGGTLFMKRRWSDKETLKLAQVLTPMTAQMIAGPLHFMGLDCYNRAVEPTSSGFVRRAADRCRAAAKNFVPVVAARMARILPGYGIAGVYNTQWRNQWREYLIYKQVEQLRANEGAGSNKSSNNKADPGVGNLVEMIRAKKHQ